MRIALDGRALTGDRTYGCSLLQNRQYMLMPIGWRDATRVHRPLFYLRLKDYKIRVEEDWMKEGIANALIQAGIPASDIVLALNPPEPRIPTALFANI